jgi:cupin fold WbuC family metalloprotein
MSADHPTIKHLNDALLEGLGKQADLAQRKRTNFNLHESLDDPVQRFLNAMQPGTYVRPHRHNNPVKWELTVALRGRAAVLILDPNGLVLNRIELNAMGPELGVEIPAGTWHTYAALAPDTVLLEVKRGPYLAHGDKDFAEWAPAEGMPSCAAYEARLRNAQPGDSLIVKF